MRILHFLLTLLGWSVVMTGSVTAMTPSSPAVFQQEEGGEAEQEPELEGLFEEQEEEDILNDELDDLLDMGASDDSAGDSVLREFKGFVELQFRLYVADRDQGRNDEELRLNSELEFDFDFSDSLTGYLRTRVFFDFLDEDTREFEPYEAYLTWEGDGFDVRVGQFVENWGIVDTFNPIDVISRRDLRTDFLDADRLGELGLRLRVFWAGGETLGEPTISFYAMPVFRKTPFPSQDNRFNFDQPGLPFDDDPDFDPDGFEEGLYAVRFQGSLFTTPLNADIQALISRGPEKFPDIGVRGGAVPIALPNYFGAWTFGAGIRAVPNEDALGTFLAKITFKAELVYKKPYSFDGSPNKAPDDYFAFVVGIDRVFNDLILDQDQLTLTLEYAREEGANDLPSRFRPLRNDLIVRFYWEANDFSRTTFEARALFDLDEDEIIWELIFKRQLRFIDEDLSLTVQVQGFEASDRGNTLYGIFPDNTSILIGLRWNF